MNEIVVISGKGGTGKTTIVGAFAAIAQNKVMADCDVDAADLHLLLKPEVKESEEFFGGNIACIDRNLCIECEMCPSLCRFNAIHEFVVDPTACEGCSFCTRICPTNAITMKENLSGHIYRSTTRYGSLIHAKLGVAQGNSGKLVTMVRQRARSLATEESAEYIIYDGSPGIGCPVIASLIGIDLALVITEPTLSGIHDMKRILEVCQRLGTPTVVGINKYDINEDNSCQIENYCLSLGVKVISKIPFDSDVNAALADCKTIIEYSESRVSNEMKKLWRSLVDMLYSQQLTGSEIARKGG